MRLCTVITRNDLPRARVLAASFAEHHPAERVVVLLLDDVNQEFSADGEPFELLRPASLALGRREFHQLATIYDSAELARAVKPWLLMHLLDEGADAAVYLAPDIEVFAPLDEIAGLAKQHGLVIAPESPDPVALDRRTPGEHDLFRDGAFSQGFMAVSPAARDFLEWWSERPRHEASLAHSDPALADQAFAATRWLDLIPGYFDHHVLRSPACVISFWHLIRHELTEADGACLIDGVPLRFFRFGGYTPESPYMLSNLQGPLPRVRLGDNPTLLAICQSYGEKLEAAGYREWRDKPYGFDVTANGLKLDALVKYTCRRFYRRTLTEPVETDPPAPDPYDTAEAEAFRDWLRQPAYYGPRAIPRFLLTLYEIRYDLQAAFPRLWESDSQKLLAWATGGGDPTSPISPELLPDEPAPGKTGSRVWPSKFKPGVNIIGHMNTETGLGEAARLMVAILEAGDIPYAVVPPIEVLGCREVDAFSADGLGDPVYDTSIFCLNADGLPMYIDRLERDFLHGRSNIGYWAWEVEKFPEWMARSSVFVDEIWVYGDFVRKAIEAEVDKPVYCCPIPIRPLEPSTLSRKDVGLRDGFMFYFSFDFGSIAERKNPRAVIEAFKGAFAPGEGPILVIKSMNGEKFLSEMEKMKHAAAGRPDIFVMDGYVPRERQNALMNLCDAYVSLHRAEGFGLTMAEAMALGKPVIATGYSGNLEFMDEENSFLVPYSFTTVPPGLFPYPENARWADPDIGEASRLMRLVHDNPAEAQARAAQARRDIREKHSPEARVKFVAGRLAALRRKNNAVAQMKRRLSREIARARRR